MDEIDERLAAQRPEAHDHPRHFLGLDSDNDAEENLMEAASLANIASYRFNDDDEEDDEKEDNNIDACLDDLAQGTFFPDSDEEDDDEEVADAEVPNLVLETSSWYDPSRPWEVHQHLLIPVELTRATPKECDDICGTYSSFSLK